MSRTDGSAAIGDYGLLSDGRSLALVAADGAVDWWGMPRLDSVPVLDRLLDPTDGGYFRLAPEGGHQLSRRYLPGTNVLELTFSAAEGEARVLLALNTGAGHDLPWVELACRVEAVRGTLPLHWELQGGTGLGAGEPWLELRGEVPLLSLGESSLAVIQPAGGDLQLFAHGATGRLIARPGRVQAMGLVGSLGQPLWIPAPEDLLGRLERTVSDWRRWSSQLGEVGEWTGAVHRSALTLRALLISAQGAIAAAGTTSLPERIGGDKNWDYRFSWIRDSSFALDSMIGLGLHEEVQGAVQWLLRALRSNGPEPRILYTLEGLAADDVESEAEVPGYRESRPVRLGNAAASQQQLGIYGDLFDTVHRYVDAGHLLDRGTGQLLASLADRCCDFWKRRDSGLWELDDLQHYTISKMGCWVALDRAARLARAGQLPDRGLQRWEAEARAVREWVLANCWSEAKGSYTFYAGTEKLDAAVLLAARTGFDRGPRLRSTITAVQRELCDGAFVYRYSGMQEEEGAFVACGFWVAEALARSGQVEAGREQMRSALQMGNDLGLFAEQVDAGSGVLLGNFPQALSHLSLINTAHVLEGRPSAGSSGG